jgi:hypothetical protein
MVWLFYLCLELIAIAGRNILLAGTLPAPGKKGFNGYANTEMLYSQ